ncbi:MAG: anaerobic sulfatase maturase [Bacteroidetes bacterium]|nr:anaerobic sulfatase maturase [Bacteroidota bacterium]
MIRKPLNTIIVKTTGSRCNLNCDYCFYLRKDLVYNDQNVMKEEVLENFIRQLIEQSGSSFGIVWQGGEPSLAGAAFFRKAISLMIKYGEGKNKLISNLLQTNGYALSNDLIDVLAEYSFLVGISIDGPEDIHNAFRKTASGKGSWKEVMRSWQKLEDRKIATNILSCITANSSKQAERIYIFFKKHSMQWLQFIPVMEFDKNGSIADFSVSAKDWGNFMCQIFDFWYQDFLSNNQLPSIRFIENAFQAHLGLAAVECTFAEECGNYLVLEHNGDVFSCDYLVGTDTNLGNIEQNKLIEMLNSNQQIDFGKEKTNMHTDCNNCRWLRFCYGGCLKYRDNETNKNYFCESWKQFLNYSESRFELIAEQYIKTHPEVKNTSIDISGYFQ